MTARPAEAQADATVRSVLTGIWLLSVAETIVWAAYFYSFAGFLFVWEQVMPWNKAELTLAFTLALLAAAAVSPLAGRLIDAGRGGQVLTFGAVLGGLALAALPQVTSHGGFLFLWALIGAACGFCLYDPCFAFVARNTGSQARAHITRISLVAGFASTICFPAAAWLTGLVGWEWAVRIFAAVALGLGAPLMWWGAARIERRRPGGDQMGERSAQARRAVVRRALRQAAFWYLLAGFALIGVTRGILQTHVIPILVDRGLSPASAVAVASTIGPMQVVGRILMARFGGAVGSITLTVASFAGIALATGLLLIGAHPVFAWGFAVLFGAAFGLSSILKTAVTVEVFGAANVGAISGLQSLPFLAGFAAAPSLGSLLWLAGGYDLALVVALMLAAAAAVAILALRHAARDAPVVR